MPPRVRQNQMMVDGEFTVPRRSTPVPSQAPVPILTSTPTRTTTTTASRNRNVMLPDGGIDFTPQPTQRPTVTFDPTVSIDPLEAAILDRTITTTQDGNNGNDGNLSGGNVGGANGGNGGGTEQVAAAGLSTKQVAARDALREWLATYFGIDSAEYKAAFDFVDQQILNEESEDAIRLNLRKQSFYQERFKGNQGRVKAGLAELSPYDYLQAESQYAEVLKRAGLQNLGTRQRFADLIGGQVSAIELQDRVVNVYDRIVNADDALRQQLQSLKTRAGLTDQDLAESLLLGEEGSMNLQKKIRQAEIRTEAATRNLVSRLGDVELERLGLTRAQAAAGFEAISTELQPLERLSQIYERQAPAAAPEIQTELERETFLGQTSQRRRRLVQQEAATFAGSAGTTPTLASRARAGQF